jgi:hypothetical protein
MLTLLLGILLAQAEHTSRMQRALQAGFSGNGEAGMRIGENKDKSKTDNCKREKKNY